MNPLCENPSEIDCVDILIRYYHSEYDAFELAHTDLKIKRAIYNHNKNKGHHLHITWVYIGLEPIHHPESKPKFNVDPRVDYITNLKVNKLNKYIRQQRIEKILK